MERRVSHWGRVGKILKGLGSLPERNRESIIPILEGFVLAESVRVSVGSNVLSVDLDDLCGQLDGILGGTATTDDLPLSLTRLMLGNL
jgi:hypothetical protein